MEEELVELVVHSVTRLRTGSMKYTRLKAIYRGVLSSGIITRSPRAVLIFIA